MARTLVAGPIPFTGSAGTTLETYGGFTRVWGTANFAVINTAGTALTFVATGSEVVFRRTAGGETFGESQYAKATVGALAWSGDTRRVGVVVQASADVGAGAADFYSWHLRDDSNTNRSTFLDKWVNGTATNLDTRSIAWTNGDTISLEFDSATSTLLCYRNDVLVFSKVDTASPLSGGRPGLYLRGASQVPTMDDWEAGDVGSAPSGYTLTSASGTFTQTGVAAALLRSRLTTASAGTFTLAGQAATLTKATPRTLTAATGSFVINVAPSTSLVDRTLTAAPAAFALTGRAATLTKASAGARVLAADTGAIVLTGRAATLTKTTLTHRTLVAAAGLFLLTGRAASLSTSAASTMQPFPPRRASVNPAGADRPAQRSTATRINLQ